MDNTLITKYGTVTIKKAVQERPYHLCKKFFKSKEHRDLVIELGDVVKKYYPNYKHKDIINLYNNLSNSGCTYAAMANIIIEQLNNDDEAFKQYFGYSLKNKNGIINYDKLMLDIYACLSQMVELRVSRFERRKFGSLLEAAESILDKEYIDENEASLDLFNAGWIADGYDNEGMLVFKNRHGISETFTGNCREIAARLFDIDDIDMNKDKLEKILKDNEFEYRFDSLEIASKLSGLSTIRANNLKKWMNKYFAANMLDLKLDTEIIESSGVDYEEFLNNIYSKINDGYSIDVSASPLKGEVWMTDGKEWTKPNDKAGHQMNFEGFDKDGNILVCSWGKNHMFPKEFYKQLEFMAVKLLTNNRSIKRSI